MVNDSNKLIPIIAGPTGTGKTKFAIRLAKGLSGEIVNVDSTQMYQGFSIGTNKGKLSPVDEVFNGSLFKINAFEMEDSGVDGWLFNFLKPTEKFNINYFQTLAFEIIENILERKKTPILVGGSGLYIDSLQKKYALSETEQDFALREKLAKLEVTELLSFLYTVDSFAAESLNNSDRNNPHRLIRMIEKASVNQKEKMTSTEIKESFAEKMKIDFSILYPIFNKGDLFKKINKRVEEMFDEGWIEEVENLIKKGYKDSEAMNIMGYREINDYLSKNKYESIKELKDKIMQLHRNYASRQVTWFEGTGRSYELNRLNFEVQNLEEITQTFQKAH